MLKEQLEKYRACGGWLLLFTISSFWSIIKILPSFLSLVTVLEQYTISSEEMIALVFILITALVNDGFLIFRCIGIVKRRKNRIIISLIFIPVMIFILIIVASAMGVRVDDYFGDLFLSILGCTIWVTYFTSSERTFIYFMPEAEYETLLEQTPTVETLQDYMEQQKLNKAE